MAPTGRGCGDEVVLKGLMGAARRGAVAPARLSVSPPPLRGLCALRPTLRQTDAPQPGFSLLEALIALTIVGVVLLFGFALQAQQLRQRQGLAIEERLLSRGRSLVVSLQTGVHPLRVGLVDASLAWPDPGDEGDVFSVDLEPGPLPGLCEVGIRGMASTPTGGFRDLRLDTRIWRPGHPCR